MKKEKIHCRKKLKNTMDNVPVDVVVTYVDNTDPYWQDQIS